MRIESLEQVERYCAQFRALDIPREDETAFLDSLIARRDAWFCEVGEVGLVYLTHILPHLDAQIHVAFWDQRLTKDRQDAVRTVAATAFRLFDLARITAMVPATNKALWSFAMKVGFTSEGRMRNRTLADGVLTDLWILGVLPEEAQSWPSLMTSGASPF